MTARLRLALLLRVSGGLLVLAAGALHLWLYFDFFHRVHVIGVLFLLNAAAAAVVGTALALIGGRWLAAFAIGYSAATLAAFFLSVYHGLFGYTERLGGGKRRPPPSRWPRSLRCSLSWRRGRIPPFATRLPGREDAGRTRRTETVTTITRSRARTGFVVLAVAESCGVGRARCWCRIDGVHHRYDTSVYGHAVTRSERAG